MKNLLLKLHQYQFLLEELVKRDFKKKYKRTVLGMFWSILSPLFTLLIMSLVFTKFFGRNTPHFTIYLFAGNLVFAFFKESTNGGLNALVANAAIFSKVNIPKYLFVVSKNVSAVINFLITFVVFFIFCLFDKITFSWRFVLLIYPITCLIVFNIGIGMILSAMQVFFEDTKYLYDLFTMLLMYLSAIFYDVAAFSENIQRVFLLNPVYVYIKYIRLIVINGTIPSLQFHALALFYAVAAITIGYWVYKKNNHKFLFYV